jgi:energy-coupling factor transport system substrate-specific component
MFGGVTGAGTDFATTFLVSVGQKLIESVAIANLTTNLADKILTCVIAFVIASRMPNRFTASFPFYQHSAS